MFAKRGNCFGFKFICTLDLSILFNLLTCCDIPNRAREYIHRAVYDNVCNESIRFCEIKRPDIRTLVSERENMYRHMDK